MRLTTRHCRGRLPAQLLLMLALIGCARGPYRYGEFSGNGSSVAEVVIERGEPNKRLDRMSDVVSWPRRTLFPELPDKRDIHPETIEQVAEYLEKNDLHGVRVSVRDYQPREQWHRLRESQVVPPLTKYTIGSLSVVSYTLLPGRVFGRNSYNPYTDTLYVNSEAPALLVHEAAFAKNVRKQPLPGIYAVSSHLPLLAAWSEVDGAREVIGYAQTEQNWDLEQQSYREVYPKVGAVTMRGTAALAPVWWGGPLISLAGGAVGGAAGRAALANRENEMHSASAQLVEQQVTGRAPTSDGVQQASYAEPAGRSRGGRRYVTPSEYREPDAK